MHNLLLFFLFAVLVGIYSPAYAVNPDEVLENPVLENRARTLSTQIRCLVCQNQSIDDSDAELARELRVLVREKLTEGLGDQQILDFLVERYGEFVLLKPPLNLRTYVLWSAPLLLLLIGAGGLMLYSRSTNGQRIASGALSKEEKELLSKALNEDK